MATDYDAILVGGISTMKIKAVGDDAYYLLPLLEEPKYTIKGIEGPDQTKRNISSQLAELEITGKIKMTGENMLQLLIAPAKQIQVSCGLTNGKFLSSANVAALSWLGWKGKFSNEVDADGNRCIEFRASGRLLLSSVDNLFSTDPATGTPNATDYFYGFLAIDDNAFVFASGVTQVRIKGSGAYASLLYFQNVKVTAEGLPNPDHLKRDICKSVAVSVSLERTQSDATAIAEAQALLIQNNTVEVTFFDGTVLETAGLGFGAGLTNAGDPDKLEFVEMHMEGRLTQTQWAAAIGTVTVQWLISGRILDVITGGTLEGAVLTWTDTTEKTVLTDEHGYYELYVSNDWSGALTPTLEDYTLSPTHIDFVTVSADTPDQNFIGTEVV